MLIKIFSTTILLVVSWLTVTSTSIWGDVKRIESELAEVQSSIRQNSVTLKTSSQKATDGISQQLDKYIQVQNENLVVSENLEAEAQTLKTTIESKESQIIKLKNANSLNLTYTAVLQAEIFSLRKNGDAASAALLGTKKAIYKAASIYPNHAKKIKQLMGPIDVLAAAWKKGDFSKSSIEIRKTLKDVIKISGV